MRRVAGAAAGIAASALLSWLYAQGGAGWCLGFVALAPWLRTLDARRTVAATLLAAWAMSVAYTAAVFAWFGGAIGSYMQLGPGMGVALLLLAAPLFQPQFLAFALVRHVARRRWGRTATAAVAAAAWVACEWGVPRLLGDTFGHGLSASHLLSQAADLGGAAGLTLGLLLANEAFAAAMARRHQGVRALARPLALATLVPLLLAAYGAVALADAAQTPSPPTPAHASLRMGLVQSNIVDYERLRREHGAAAVVSEVLDTHAAMTLDAVERHRVDAVLWSETVYPTTFGQPKSEAGAEFDREILALVEAAGVPLVFGTYDRDGADEYNAAAFVAPGTGLVGLYRKTRPFPLTEQVPAVLEGPALRRWLPWAGTWRAGTGARVFPLRLKDGREVPVLPLICLDDMDSQLAIDGARLGAQVLLTLSNDAWFTEPPLGAGLHQAAAIFRSIETRLPQFRVTPSGHSAVIDATGRVIAGSRLGERTLVIGEVALREPPRTLMVLWGDWVGRSAALLLLLLGAFAALRTWRARRGSPSTAGRLTPALPGLPADVVLLSPAVRWAVGLLQAFARGSLLWMAVSWVGGDSALQADPLAHLRTFAMLFLAPEAAAWCVLRAHAARATIEDDALVLQRGARRLEVPLSSIAAVEAWRVPLPGPGAHLRLTSGQPWPLALAHPDAEGLAGALAAAGAPLLTSPEPPPWRASLARRHAQARRDVPPSRLDHPLLKFGLLPLVLAVPAFRLHQHIAYGSAFGQAQASGWAAYLGSFAVAWATWAIGVVLCAAVLRTAIEAGTLLVSMLAPSRAAVTRRWLERLGLAALYLGLPTWLLLRLFMT